MEWTNGSQVYDLLLSCGLGFLLGAYYDVFRVLRLALKSGKRAIFFQDVFFFASAAVITFKSKKKKNHLKHRLVYKSL